MGVYIRGYNIEGLKDMLEHCGADPYLLDVINMTRVPEPHGRLIDEADLQGLADSINDAYNAGYNVAKCEIALSGEYERAYQRGKADATKWIPCSERLPDKVGYYITSNDMNDVEITWLSHYTPDDEFVWEENDSTILAWMPLPEPWKGE